MSMLCEELLGTALNILKKCSFNSCVNPENNNKLAAVMNPENVLSQQKNTFLWPMEHKSHILILL